MIIGVCGFIGSGKDTVADYLVANYEYKRQSFAGTLKDAVAQVFNWDRELLEGKTKEGREWREHKDQWWSDRLGMEITPRGVLQTWGTEVCRNGFHDDIWVASLENKLLKTNQSVVISDCRFPNEIKAIHNAGGKVIRVIRGSEPDWINDAKKAADGAAGYSEIMEAMGVHKSEWAWTSAKFDYIIANNGSIEDLYVAVNEIASIYK